MVPELLRGLEILVDVELEAGELAPGVPAPVELEQSAEAEAKGPGGAEPAANDSVLGVIFASQDEDGASGAEGEDFLWSDLAGRRVDA